MAIPYRAAFQFLANQWADELVVTSAGNSSQMWWDVTRDADRVFYLDASMSLSTLLVSGVAYECRRQRFGLSWATAPLQ